MRQVRDEAREVDGARSQSAFQHSRPPTLSIRKTEGFFKLRKIATVRFLSWPVK